jgi:hypothetical protein
MAAARVSRREVTGRRAKDKMRIGLATSWARYAGLRAARVFGRISPNVRTTRVEATVTISSIWSRDTAPPYAVRATDARTDAKPTFTAVLHIKSIDSVARGDSISSIRLPIERLELSARRRNRLESNRNSAVSLAENKNDKARSAGRSK